MKASGIKKVRSNVIRFIISEKGSVAAEEEKSVAKIEAVPKKQKIERPDFWKNLKETFDHPIKGISNAELISEMREERF